MVRLILMLIGFLGLSSAAGYGLAHAYLLDGWLAFGQALVCVIGLLVALRLANATIATRFPHWIYRLANVAAVIALVYLLFRPYAALLPHGRVGAPHLGALLGLMVVTVFIPHTFYPDLIKKLNRS